MPRILIVLLALLIAPWASFAQDNVYDSVEEMPELVGGLAALQQQIQYPEEARDGRIEGRVMVQFVVDEEGNITEPSILQSADPILDQAALEALEHVEFTPGRHHGQPAKVRMILPITFVLPEATYTEDNVAEHVDEMPTIVGGMEALIALLEYPAEAEARGIEGRVVISFIVEKDGRVEEAEVASSADPLLDEAALEAVRKVAFTPGRSDGETVRVRMALPVNFQLPAQN